MLLSLKQLSKLSYTDTSIMKVDKIIFVAPSEHSFSVESMYPTLKPDEMASTKLQTTLVTVSDDSYNAPPTVPKPAVTSGCTLKYGDFTFKIINNVMEGKEAEFAIDTSILAFTKFINNKDRAEYIREKFDEKFSKYWQCIMTKEAISASLYPMTGHHIIMEVKGHRILIFKTHCL